MGSVTDKKKPPLLLPWEKPERKVPAWMLWLAALVAVTAAVVSIAVLVT